MKIATKAGRLTSWVFLAAWTALPAFGAGSVDALAQRLQKALDDVVASSGQQLGAMASVSAPRLDVEWSGAAGRAARDDPHPLKPNQPFRIASVTKVFVAAAIFRLIEEDRLGLYDPIARYISTETAQTLRSGGYDPTSIQIAHLLAHTSGLYDYAMDAGYGRATTALENKSKRWTRPEQIRWAVEHGKPIGHPGEKYSYADTNYVVLGEIIERVSGQSMPAYIRQSLKFDATHLTATYFETLEPAPAHLLPRAHQYYDAVDNTDFDPSFDLYGGGGLDSTTADLNRFFRALLTGRLFNRPSTLAAGLLPTDPQKHPRHQRAYLLATVPFGSHTCWGHLGYWGTTALYCPDIDVAVATTIDQSLDDEAHDAGANRRKLLNGIAECISDALEHARRNPH